MTIGNRIKKCRVYHKLTQRELSVQLGLTAKMISFYENDERIPPADILIKLSKIFSVSTDYLLGVNIEKKDITFSTLEDELLNGYRKLSVDDQEELLEILRMKLKKKNKNKGEKSSNSTDPNNLVG